MERVEREVESRLGPDELMEFKDEGIGGQSYGLKKSWAEFKEWASPRGGGRGHIHIAGITDRPGVKLWATELERIYYWPPGSTRNELITVHAAVWLGMLWQIVSVPLKHERFAERVATRIGLRVVKGFPAVYSAAGRGATVEDTFPIRGEAVRTLEFLEGSELERKARAGHSKTLRDVEDALVARGRASARGQTREN
jgi:hypothetical protein